MILGRFVTGGLTLLLFGNFATKKINLVQSENLKSNTPIFFLLLISVIVLLSLLTFVPILLLGPISEFFSLSMIII